MKKRILIIDDDPSIRSVLEEVLTDYNCEVETAKNGAEGLEAFEIGKYDIILTDIDMPLMNGMEFYERLIEKAPCIKERIMFITSITNIKSKMFLEKTKARCIMKPFAIAELFKAIDKFSVFRPGPCSSLPLNICNTCISR